MDGAILRSCSPEELLSPPDPDLKRTGLPLQHLEPGRIDKVAHKPLCRSTLYWPDSRVELGPFVSWGRVYLAFRARLLLSPVLRCPTLRCARHELPKPPSPRGEASPPLLVKIHTDTTLAQSKGKREMAVEAWLYAHRLGELAPAWHGMYATTPRGHDGRLVVAILEDAGVEVDVAQLSPAAKYVLR